MSASTAHQCHGLHFRPVGNLYLKGKTKGLMAYEALSEEDAGSERVQGYRSAFEQLGISTAVSRKTFDDLAARYPDDALIALHQGRLAEGQTGADIILDRK